MMMIVLDVQKINKRSQQKGESEEHGENVQRFHRPKGSYIGVRCFINSSLSLTVAGVTYSYDDLDSASQLNVNLAIPPPKNVHDYQTLAVHSVRDDRTLARIALPSTLVVPPYFGRDGKKFHSCLVFGALPFISRRTQAADIFLPRHIIMSL